MRRNLPEQLPYNLYSSRARHIWRRYTNTCNKLQQLWSLSKWTDQVKRRIASLLARLQRYARQLSLSSLGILAFVGIDGEKATAQPIGPEFLVNTWTTNWQYRSAIAMDADGDFVIVWENLAEQDDSSSGIFGQIYNADGTPFGGEFQINSYTMDAQAYPAVAMDADGDFVVVWQSYQQEGMFSSNGIYGQRFSSNGTKVGSEFLVNTHTTDNQRQPEIAMDANGDFVVVWESYQQASGTSDWDLYGQRFSANGTKQGSEFRVNSYSINRQLNPTVAMDADGDFVVAWQSRYQDGPNGFGIYAQRYQSNGVKSGGEFRVNSYVALSQGSPSVAMDSDGDFIVAWQSNGQQMGHGYSIYAQRYQSNGATSGMEFAVSDSISQSHFSGGASIAMDEDGDFMVTWTDGFQDGDLFGIRGRCFNANGTTIGDEFQVNTTTTDMQLGSSVAMDDDGDFTITWQSYRIEGPDIGTSSGAWPKYGVAAQRYQSKFTGDCPNTPLDLTGSETGSITHQTQMEINSDQQIQSGASVIYKSPVSTVLDDGFEVQSGATFEVSTDNCSGL